MLTQVKNDPIDGKLLEKIIINNDLSGLTPLEKVSYVTSICKHLGLNPMTKPFQLLKFQGKEVPYVTKDATEQLRKINGVSIHKLETKILDGGIYVVTAYAKTPDGREDISTGAIVISGLKGDALANAIMKAETKAKRRSTLSICGLGFMDESEIDTIPDAKKVDISTFEVVDDKTKQQDLMKVKIVFNGCSDIEALEKNYFFMMKTYSHLRNEIVALKDQRKEELMIREEVRQNESL